MAEPTTREEAIAELYRMGALEGEQKAAAEELMAMGAIPDLRTPQGQPPSEEEIDDETGASWKDRFIVGSANDDATKLERARGRYGNETYMADDGRIVFRNPDTGKMTYMNPSGFDPGDIAGSLREIGSTVASIPASIFGAVGGGGANLVTGALAGSAAGTAASQGIDALAAKMARSAAEERGNTVPKVQSLGDAATEAGTEFGIGALGGTALGLAGKGIGKALNPLKQEAVKYFRDAGIKIPTIGSVMDSPWLTRQEDNLSTLIGGGSIGKARQQALDGLTDYTDRLASQVAGGGEPPAVGAEALGRRTLAGVDAAKNMFRDKENAFYQDFLDRNGGKPVVLSNVQRTIDDALKRYVPGSESEQAARAGWEGLVQHGLNDSNNGMYNFAMLRDLRSRLGDIAFPKAGTALPDSVSKGRATRLWQGATDDARAALSQDPAASGEWAAWREGVEAPYYRAAKKLDDSLLGNRDDVGKIGERLLSPNLQHETADSLKELLPKVDYDQVRGGIIRNLGRDLASNGTAPGTVNPTTMSRMLGGERGGMNHGTIDSLFGDVPEMDTLKGVSSQIAKSVKDMNPSGTAKSGAVGAQLIGAWPTYGATLWGPYLASKTLTSQPLINFLARPQSATSKAILNGMFPQMGRVGGSTARNLIERVAEDEQPSE